MSSIGPAEAGPGPAEAGPEARRETQQTPDRNTVHCRARRCRHRPDYAGAAGPPARSGSLERRHRPLWHFAGAVCVDAICLRACAGCAIGSFRPAAGLARLAVRRRYRLRHHGDGAFPLGSLYRAHRGRHHRATGAVAGAYIADITDGDERARYFGFMSACFGFGMVAGPVLGGLMSSFSPCSVLRRSSLEWPQFPDGHFPFAGVAQRRTSTITPGGSQPARFVPVGPGHDRHRRPDGCLLHHATRRTGAGHALGHLRRGSLSLGHELDRHFACRIWYSTFTRPAMITGPVTTGLGERRALMLGMIADGAGYILLALATRGWMAFPIMVLLASGGIGMPALQAVLSAGR